MPAEIPNPLPPTASIENKPFVSSLFDTRFTSFITPRVTRVIFVLWIIFAAIRFVAALILGTLATGPFVVLIFPVALFFTAVEIVYARVIVELALAFFTGLGYLARIADNTSPRSDEATQ